MTIALNISRVLRVVAGILLFPSILFGLMSFVFLPAAAVSGLFLRTKVLFVRQLKNGQIPSGRVLAIRSILALLLGAILGYLILATIEVAGCDNNCGFRSPTITGVAYTAALSALLITLLPSVSCILDKS